MGTIQIANKLDNWFKDRALAMMYVSKGEVENAVKLQLKLKKEQGRDVRLWECHIILGHMNIEQTDHVLNGLGRGDVPESKFRPNTLGKILVETGYIKYEQLIGALEVQANERGEGVWRLLGQILIDHSYLNAEQLADALKILEDRRKPKDEEDE